MPKDTLSKRIRDLTRLLALDSLPETTRQEKERALASLRAEKTASKRVHDVHAMVQRYKMVKFVEHQKAVRRLAQAKKSLGRLTHAVASIAPPAGPQEEGDDDDDRGTRIDEEETDVASAREEVRRRKVDVVYVENFPILEKYISLYRDVDGNAQVEARRREIWQMAERGVLRKGTLTLDGEYGGADDGNGKRRRKDEADRDEVVVTQEEEADDFFE